MLKHEETQSMSDMPDIEAMLESLTLESMDAAIQAAEAAEEAAYELHVKPLATRAEKLRVYRKALRAAEAELVRKHRVQKDNTDTDTDEPTGVVTTMDDLDREYARSTEAIRACVEALGPDVTPGAVARKTGYRYSVVYQRLNKRTDLFRPTGRLGVPKFSLASDKPAPKKLDPFAAISGYLSVSGPQKPESIATALSIPLDTVSDCVRGRAFEVLTATGEYRLRR